MGLILAGLPLDIVTLASWPDVTAPEETGATYQENARLKAKYYARATGVWTVAEDSGFEVDALDGAPGLYSARFGGESASFPEKFARIRTMLRERGIETSTARFVCALTLVRDDEIEFEAVGTVEGTLAPSREATEASATTRSFSIPPWNSTLAEIPDDKKAEVSHRGRAFRKLREYLEGSKVQRSQGGKD